MNFLLFFVINLVIINSFKFKTFKRIINGIKYSYKEPKWTEKIYNQNKKLNLKTDKKSDEETDKNILIVPYDPELDFMNFVDLYGNYLEPDDKDLL